MPEPIPEPTIPTPESRQPDELLISMSVLLYDDELMSREAYEEES